MVSNKNEGKEEKQKARKDVRRKKVNEDTSSEGLGTYILPTLVLLLYCFNDKGEPANATVGTLDSATRVTHIRLNSNLGLQIITPWLLSSSSLTPYFLGLIF